jgi:ribosomal protein L40E
MPEETVGYVELEWTCVHCGTKNAGTRQNCSGCGAPMSDSQKFVAPAEQHLITDKDALAKAVAGPDIHCPWCGTRNPAGSPKCSHCGGDLTGGTARAQGEVLGAFQNAHQPDVKCQYCGTMNPADAKKCSKCGSALVSPAAPKPAAQPTAFHRISVIPIILVGLVIVACITIFVLTTRTTDAIGTVQSVAWQRSIAIMAQRPVQHQAWKDQVPSGAALGSCTQKVRRTQDTPTQNSQKVCGTAFTQDQGNGTGKVVQNCQYNVMDDYCAYTSNEWQQVDAVVAKGTDNNPRSPNPTLNTSQRAGSTSESYQVIFLAGDKSYSYSARNVQEFAQLVPGTKWTLKVNGLGAVTSVSPAK